MNKWMCDLSLNSTPVAGIALRPQVLTVVRWAYLALPGATLLAGTGFVLFCIFETHRTKLPAWKGSTMATLAYGLDEEPRALLREAGRAGGVDRGARQFIAVFGDDNMTLRIRRGGKETGRFVVRSNR